MLSIQKVICCQRWSAHSGTLYYLGSIRVNWIDISGVRESWAVCPMSYQWAAELVGSGNDVCVYTVYAVNLILCKIDIMG